MCANGRRRPFSLEDVWIVASLWRFLAEEREAFDQFLIKSAKTSPLQRRATIVVLHMELDVGAVDVLVVVPEVQQEVRHILMGVLAGVMECGPSIILDGVDADHVFAELKEQLQHPLVAFLAGVMEGGALAAVLDVDVDVNIMRSAEFKKAFHHIRVALQASNMECCVAGGILDDEIDVFATVIQQRLNDADAALLACNVESRVVAKVERVDVDLGTLVVLAKVKEALHHIFACTHACKVERVVPLHVLEVENSAHVVAVVRLAEFEYALHHTPHANDGGVVKRSFASLVLAGEHDACLVGGPAEVK
mmetsp:Transcript_22590/g.63035  ORF Transcript_22590/g.63035 Transcript_22590/m.63035 type:complete len:307 (+) Transcript_22590:217-1137(+)